MWLQVKFDFRHKFFNLGWFSVSFRDNLGFFKKNKPEIKFDLQNTFQPVFIQRNLVYKIQPPLGYENLLFLKSC